MIDTGKLNQSDYGPKKNFDVVQPKLVSLANANQRTNGASCTQPDVCLRLHSCIRESMFSPKPAPEMRKTRLEELNLRIKILMLRSGCLPPERTWATGSVHSSRVLDQEEALYPARFSFGSTTHGSRILAQANNFDGLHLRLSRADP